MKGTRNQEVMRLLLLSHGHTIPIILCVKLVNHSKLQSGHAAINPLLRFPFKLRRNFNWVSKRIFKIFVASNWNSLDDLLRPYEGPCKSIYWSSATTFLIINILFRIAGVDSDVGGQQGEGGEDDSAAGGMRTGVCKWYNVTKGWVRMAKRQLPQN